MYSTRLWALLLFGARAVGRVNAFVRSAYFVNALVLGAIVASLAALDAAEVGVGAPDAAESWLTFARVLALWVGVLLAWWVVQQRRRLLIGRIEDLGGDAIAGTGAGLSVLLANELAQLRDLFIEFDEGHPTQSAGSAASSATPGAQRSQNPFEAGIQVDAQGGILEGAVSAESTLSLGPLKIPANVLLKLVNRLVQGPRLTGQLQFDGARRIATIELTFGRQQRTWRVEDAPGAPPRSLAELARELAIRIFSEFAFEEPARWTSVACLVDGLRAYRRTLRTTKGARLNLLEAERHFREAVTEDGRFDLAHYNLGIVYGALDRMDAARAAFTRSIELNPNRFDSQYALARLQFRDAVSAATGAERTQLLLALDRCDRALALSGDAEARAKVLSQKAAIEQALRGLAYFLAADTCRSAVRASLRSLMQAELATHRLPEYASRRRRQARQIASESLQQLGGILRVAAAVVRTTPVANRNWMTSLMRLQRHRAALLAAWLTPDDSDAHLALGVYLLERRRARDAIGPLQRAAQLAPQRGDAHCSLALACASLFREDDFEAAQAKAMSLLGQTLDDFLPDLAVGWRRLAAGTRLLRQQVKTIDRPQGGRIPPNLPWRVLRFQWKYAFMMSGRRLRRWSGAMTSLQLLLPERGSWIDALDALIVVRRAQSTRIRNLARLRSEAEVLVRDVQDRSTEIAALRANATTKGWTWEAGGLAEALARVATNQGRNNDAIAAFRQAIDTFAPEYPAQIAARGLYARLARALLATGMRGDALEAAHRAASIDPMNAFERNQLASCHFELSEWSRARGEWEESLRFAPDEPHTYYNIAMCWHNEGGAADSSTERRRCLQNAAEDLERALSLFGSDDPGRLDGQFLLGRIKCSIGSVNEGLALWQALESRQFRPVYLGLHIADGMLREVSLEGSKVRFEALAVELDARCAREAGLSSQPIDTSPGDQSSTTHGEALVWAELGAALAIARRQGAVDEAIGHAHRARAALVRLDDPTLRRRWGGDCDRIEGEILLRQGDTPGAIRLLERALTKTTHVENYRNLAAALLQQLDPAVDDAASRVAVARISALIDHAEKIDLDAEHTASIAQLRARLAKVEATKWLS